MISPAIVALATTVYDKRVDCGDNADLGDNGGPSSHSEHRLRRQVRARGRRGMPRTVHGEHGTSVTVCTKTEGGVVIVRPEKTENGITCDGT